MAALSSPQPLVVGETTQKAPETILNHTAKQSYASNLLPKKAATKIAKLELCPVTFVHGEPRVEFTVEEVNQFTIEEGLHQAVIVKFSYGKPELQEFRKIFAKQFDIKGYCNIGQLEFRHLLVRFDSFDDYVQFVSRSAGYIKSKGDEFFFRTFPWTLGFNPKEETSKSVVWISFPDLPPNFFAKKSLMSIASAVGKPLAVDKATQDRTRPSAARVKVLLDLLDKHPKKVKIHIVDKASGKSVEFYQMVVYDNLPKYCTCCNHQGHAEETCRWKVDESKHGADVVDATEGIDSMNKLQGNARSYFNVKSSMQQSGDARKEVLIDQQRIQSTGDQYATVENPLLKENTGDDRTAAHLCNEGNDRALSDQMVKTAGKKLLAQDDQGVNDQALSNPKVKTDGKKLLSHVAQGVKNTKVRQWSVVHRVAGHGGVDAKEAESDAPIAGQVNDKSDQISGHAGQLSQKQQRVEQIGSQNGNGRAEKQLLSSTPLPFVEDKVQFDPSFASVDIKTSYSNGLFAMVEGDRSAASDGHQRASNDAYFHVQIDPPTRIAGNRASVDRAPSSDAQAHVQVDRATAATQAISDPDRASTDAHVHVQNQTNAIISAEERILLDSMENNVVSRACNDRGYESNEELSTSEKEEESSTNRIVGNPNFFEDARQILVNARKKHKLLKSTAEKSPGQQNDTPANRGKEQIKTGKQQHTTAISFHDRQLLDAMLSADPLDILSRQPYSANCGNRSKNDAHRQQQNKASCDKSQDEPNLTAQFLDLPNQRSTGNDTFVDGEVIKGLQQIVESVPLNATEEQKTHMEEKSRDDNVRRPPMRNAKLK